jgi:Double zinc ribbon
MPPLAYFGIESSGLNLVVDLLILFVVVLYLSLIYWTYADARRRIEDPMLIGCATAAAFFPFVGPLIYMVLRPPEYLEDVRERELETQAAEARLLSLDHALCPHCDYRVEPDFIRCPSCLRKLKERCTSCGRPLDQSWTICPYCEAEVPGAAPSRTRRRRGSAGASEEPATERPATGSRRRRRAVAPQTEPAEETLAVETASLPNGLDTALDVDLLGETVESDQLALSDPDGDGEAASVPSSSRVPPAPARPRRRSERPRPTS